MRNLSLILMILSITFFAIMAYCAITAGNRYSDVENATARYLRAQENLVDIQEASDYLTEEARETVLSMRIEHIANYDNEVNIEQRREKAIAELETVISNTASVEYLNKSLEQSNDLMEREIHAMALVASIQGFTADQLPESVASYELSEEELALSELDRQSAAYYLVYDVNYLASKSLITECIETASTTIKEELQAELERCSKEFHFVSITLKAIMGVYTLILAAMVTAMISLVLLPLQRSVRALEEDDKLPKSRSCEFNYLADTYNELYDRNALERDSLQMKAEKDALTGLYNRRAFDSFCEAYSRKTTPVVLILLDVDCFKNVNDTYGHEVGDQVLQKVASLLLENFRTDDYPIRYGGDEFAVIMSEITIDQKGIIDRKLTYINSALQNLSAIGFPSITVSAGVAFSPSGYTGDLLRKADEALYYTKNHGKCGFTFYDEMR